ncbi:hypothetical protein ACGFX4_09645 [Kitasatospora sp. NPDC048365]|uniref:hypothetical protein n=1 Tax=Kitasatospora sp. NPDC048365 TaxID=3364050 RepID=UPI0037242379
MAEREEGRTHCPGSEIPAQRAGRHGRTCRAEERAARREDRYDAEAAWLCEAERYAVLGED